MRTFRAHAPIQLATKARGRARRFDDFAIAQRVAALEPPAKLALCQAAATRLFPTLEVLPAIAAAVRQGHDLEPFVQAADALHERGEFDPLELLLAMADLAPARPRFSARYTQDPLGPSDLSPVLALLPDDELDPLLGRVG